MYKTQWLLSYGHKMAAEAPTWQKSAQHFLQCIPEWDQPLPGALPPWDFHRERRGTWLRSTHHWKENVVGLDQSWVSCFRARFSDEQEQNQSRSQEARRKVHGFGKANESVCHTRCLPQERLNVWDKTSNDLQPLFQLQITSGLKSLLKITVKPPAFFFFFF